MKREDKVESQIERLTSQDERVRAAAAEALGGLGDGRAFEPLASLLLSDLSYRVRLQAAWSLAKLGDPRTADVLLHLAEAFVRPGGMKDYDTLSALVQFADRRAVDSLAKVLRFGSRYLSDSDLYVYHDSDLFERTAQVLGVLGGPVAACALVRALRSRYSRVQTAAADALERIGKPEAMDALLRGLGGDEGWIPFDVAARPPGNEHGGLALWYPKADASWDVGTAAQWAAGNTADRRVFDDFVRGLGDPDPAVRQGCAGMLGRYGRAEAVGALARALTDAEELVRWEAAKALGQIGHPGSVEPLADALRGENAYLAQAAAEALGKIGGRQAVAALVDALRSASRGVRLSAIESLGEIGDSRARERLAACLGDEDEQVREAATKAIDAIEGRV